ncbi:TIGR03067 domain-containing protein [Aquisphaera insulae]|uniref:TIGR03067 domain-containing protein n=1 Tax=Aquisphaera insulae TaxID=2712864 RepID=UPI0013EA72FC|nr:TIGR03067 domain-containing protein [Aquisphaera insulae]
MLRIAPSLRRSFVAAIALAACCALTLTSARAADETAPAAALKALEGTWATSSSDALDSKWIIKGETVEVTVNGMEYKGKLKADDKAKPSSTLDIELTEAPGDAKGKTAKAIYKLEGEKLTVAIAVPGNDRPKEFEQSPDEVYLFELKKEAEKKG